MILPSRKPLPIPRPSSYASLREWFAEAREASVHDDAEVKTWKEGMKELGWCLSRNFWDRVDWSNDS